MVTKRRILRKVISSVLSSIILSFTLVFIHGYASVFVYFMYFAIGSIIIGVPCSIVTDILISKMRGTITSFLVGLILHLLFAGVIVYFFAFAEFNDPATYADVLGFSVLAASVGLWMVDSILKKIQFPK
jgi:hypothetical protein